MPSHVYAVILAGGSGTRFWPKSRQTSPKQLCRLGGSELTMLEITLARLDGFIPPERRIIVTHKDQAESTRKLVGSKCLTILAEPEARNTANALALAAFEVRHLHGKDDAIFISLHADHVVKKVDKMLEAFVAAVKLAEEGSLTLIGIVPQYAETGYGYIERGEQLKSNSSFKVASFREKPKLELARTFLESGKFYWNAGIFVFPVLSYLRELAMRVPVITKELQQALEQAKSTSFLKIPADDLANVYMRLPKISVDHAVLEVSEFVSVVEADIGWQDVGSWDALGSCFSVDKNLNFVQGDVLTIDSENCTLETDGPMIAALGLRDIVVVHAKNAILVCPKSRAQDVKLIVESLKEQGKDYLI